MPVAVGARSPTGRTPGRAQTIIVMAVAIVAIAGLSWFISDGFNDGVTSIELSGDLAADPPTVGKAPAGFSGLGYDGAPISLSDYAGQPLWLNFGASWCQDCRIEAADLEATYEKFKGERERCETRAKTVSERIDSVELVAGKLFNEWRGELKEYSNADMRRRAERMYDDTKSQYEQLLRAMKNAEAKMKPVLAAFKDQELFLKHNLNAQAIASLQETVVAIQGDVSKLIDDMQASITEADEFLGAMKSNG